MSPLLRTGTLALALVALAATARDTAAFTIAGNITDSAANILQDIRVRIYDEDTVFDSLLATVYTDAAGNYTATITDGWGPLETEPDVYILVDWYFPMRPAGTYNNHHMILTVENPAGTAFTEKKGAVVNDHNPATNLAGQNLVMNQARANAGTLRLHINEALDYYTNNKGTVTWSLPEDVMTTITTNSIVSTASVNANIAEVDITGANSPALGQGFVSDIYHEMGHWVHYRLNGNSFPPTPLIGASHSSNTETDGGFALIEGWPSYVAELTDKGTVADGKYAQYRDATNNLWLGDETPPTGRDAGSFESGEVIEGALGGVWFGWDDGANFTFSDLFRVMVEDKPNNIFDFRKEIVSNAGGAGTAKTRHAYGVLQLHGIVYSRARLTSDPFDETDPPDTGPPSEGNKKEIDGLLFLRGKVTTKVEAVPKADLGVQTSVGISKKKIGFKAANDPTADAASTIASFTPAVSFGDPLDVDTKTFGGTAGDGDWDLVAVGENDDGFTDDLMPSWAGDGTATVNSDEKYLKVLGAWYDKDRDPATNTAKEGKVVVDNTAPTVDAATFKPK